MFFQLQLNEFLPPLSILIGEGGSMYVKLVDIGVLLRKTNPYTYRNFMKHLAVQGKQVLYTVGFKIPPKTLASHYVPLILAHKLIQSELPDMANLFMKQLREGVAHTHRMRKFVGVEKKAPLLLCVEKSDDKCVSVPLWIQQFIKDLECYRRQVRNNPTTSTSGEYVKRAASASNVQYFKKIKLENDPQPGPSNEIPVVDLTSSRENAMAPAENDSKDTTPMENGSRERPAESISQDSIPVFQDTKDEPPVEPISQDSILEEPISQDMTDEPPVENISQDMTDEPPVEPISPVQRPSTPETASSSPNPRPKTHMFYVNLNNSSDQLSRSSFLEPGDLIVKFHTRPSRVYFVPDDHDALYWVNNCKRS